MSDIEKKEQPFIGYEYKEVVTSANEASFLMDGYKNFGWVMDENMNSGLTDKILDSHAQVVLRLKRDRKIMNRMELTRLQRNFEFCLKEIAHLEGLKTTQALFYALTVGIIGTAFMAGSVFAVIAEPPRIALCIILAIPAFVGWAAPYFIYRAKVRQKTEQLNLLIEEKEDEIFSICEKGNKLLY
ncbi:MAG TPA: hypothetical protein GXX75_14930 [Clostridiales bacterium]|nr:hypothetical protein [Clostridiales bacterium]